MLAPEVNEIFLAQRDMSRTKYDSLEADSAHWTNTTQLTSHCQDLTCKVIVCLSSEVIGHEERNDRSSESISDDDLSQADGR
jgi:hypothetical protein